jgi:hypothetical protein
MMMLLKYQGPGLFTNFLATKWIRHHEYKQGEIEVKSRWKPVAVVDQILHSTYSIKRLSARANRSPGEISLLVVAHTCLFLSTEADSGSCFNITSFFATAATDCRQGFYSILFYLLWRLLDFTSLKPRAISPSYQVKDR